MDCDTAGCKHEWCEEISDDLKNVPCRILMTHSWFTPDSLVCTNISTSFVCRIRFNSAVTVEMRMLCNSVEGNSHFHTESFFCVSFLFDGVETPQTRTAHLVSFCSCVWQAQTARQSMRKHELDDYIGRSPLSLSLKMSLRRIA